jgi:hypothetical protein
LPFFGYGSLILVLLLLDRHSLLGNYIDHIINVAILVHHKGFVSSDKWLSNLGPAVIRAAFSVFYLQELSFYDVFFVFGFIAFRILTWSLAISVNLELLLISTKA